MFPQASGIPPDMKVAGSQSRRPGKTPGNLEHKDYPMISIQTNIDSLIAQQNLSVNDQFQSNTIQQLTSGYRINSSSDDAAGLSVANAYRNQIAELNQGVLNANQGVSQLQIVDGGLSNISQMLDRLQTLATESDSQTFTGNRNTLNNEYTGLLSEIDRQANNIGLGDQNKTNAIDLQVYIGGGQSAEANSAVGVNLGKSSVSSAGLGLAGTNVLTTPAVVIGGAAATAIGSGNTDAFVVNTAAGTHTISVTGQADDTVQGQVEELNAQLNVLGISASLNQNGILQFQSSNAFSVSGQSNSASGPDLVNNAAASVANNTGLNSEGINTLTDSDVLTIKVGSATASYSFATDGSPAGNQADVTGINQALQSQGITGVSAVLDATGDGDTISLQGASAFTASLAASVGNGGGPATTQFNALGYQLASGDAGSPSAAIDAISQAVQTLGTVQGIVGAGENTLNYAINLAQSQITSFSAAQSQIRDANVAAEAADLTKAQVLQQASIAAMAQANQEPQAILSLLKT
jgi:flagellin